MERKKLTMQEVSALITSAQIDLKTAHMLDMANMPATAKLGLESVSRKLDIIEEDAELTERAEELIAKLRDELAQAIELLDNRIGH